jgi:hypothetical protein
VAARARSRRSPRRRHRRHTGLSGFPCSGGPALDQGLRLQGVSSGHGLDDLRLGARLDAEVGHEPAPIPTRPVLLGSLGDRLADRRRRRGRPVWTNTPAPSRRKTALGVDCSPAAAAGPAARGSDHCHRVGRVAGGGRRSGAGFSGSLRVRRGCRQTSGARCGSQGYTHPHVVASQPKGRMCLFRRSWTIVSSTSSEP